MKIAVRGDRLTVEIASLAVGGRGVARYQGLVIFVGDAAPGDVVEIELTKVKTNFAEARIVKVVTASLHRRVPPCPVAGVCGGCSWQHVDYGEQLRQKHALVVQNLRKMSGYELDEGLVEPVVPSPDEFRYRNRIQLHHSGPRMGFFKRGSHDIVDINDCPITETRITGEFSRVRSDLATRPPGRVELLIDQNGCFALRDKTVVGNDSEESTAELAGPAFAQVNNGQNRALVQFVVDAIRAFAINDGHPIFDLYAGSGNFTFPIARAVESGAIVAVELNREAVHLARARVKTEGLLIDFQQADVGDFLRRQTSLADSIVLLDPPRTGCDPAVIAALAKGLPSQIVYVSCHPVTLARDLGPLREAGFKLKRVRPFDMFPQTDHVETVAILEFPVNS